MRPSLQVEKSDWISYTVLLGLITFVFHLIYGLNILAPTNINWLMTVHGDWGGYYLGWAFFREESWSFPLGYMNTYGYPIDHNVAMTDGIPLLSLLAKPFSLLLPTSFQLYGFWLLLSHLLVGVYSLRILSLFRVQKLQATVGALLIAINPVLITRGMHCPLASHWVILASIYHYLIPSTELNVRKINVKQGIVLLLTSLINIYLTAMVAGLSIAIAIKQKLFDCRLTWFRSILVPSFSLLLVFVVWLIVGIISFGGITAQLGLSYGPYSTNTNSFFNSFGLSNILPALKIVSSEQGEGFAYLGLGFIVLFLISVFYWLTKGKTFEIAKSTRFLLPIFIAILSIFEGLPFLSLGLFTWVFAILLFEKIGASKPAITKLAYLAPLAIVSIFYLLYAYSNTPSFGDQKITLFPLPVVFEKFASMFRGNGRFVWVAYYLIILSSVVLYSRIQLKVWLHYLVFFAIAVIQIYDIVPCISQYQSILPQKSGDYDTPLADSTIIEVMKKFDAVITYPPYDKTIAYEMDYQDIAFLSLMAGKPVSAAYYSRNSDGANREFHEKLIDQINGNSLEKNYLFLTTKSHVAVFKTLIESADYELKKLDKYYCVFAKTDALSAALFEKDTTSLKQLDSLKKAITLNAVSFAKENHYLYNTTVVVPIWGDGWTASLPIKIKKGSYKVTISGFGTAALGEFANIEVMAGDKIIGDVFVDSEMKEYNLPYSTEIDEEVIFRVHLNNDLSIPGKEDRNAFVRSIRLSPNTLLVQ